MSSELCCPLCGKSDVVLHHSNPQREFYCCNSCRLIFVPESFWLSAEEEKIIYDLHQNDPEDEGYRCFLSRLTQPLFEWMPKPARCLDFGCGPGPALSMMLEEQGHSVSLYDPYYFGDTTVLDCQYDLVTATEVVEHLKEPALTLSLLFKLLKPSGMLGLMTKMVSTSHSFADWHYIRDLTHIIFFSEKTFVYLAEKFAVEFERVGADVVVFRKAISTDSGDHG